MKRAIYAGSFDPPTNGHLNVIEKSMELFDELIIAVGDNSNKTPYFAHNDRIEMLQRMTIELPNTKCKVTVDRFRKQFLVDYAREKDAKYIVRGIRNTINFREERDMFLFNKNRNSDIETIFIMPDKKVADISSSLVRGLVGYANWREESIKLVSTNVHNKLLERQFENEYRNVVDGLKKYDVIISENEIKEVLKFLRLAYNVNSRSYHNLNHILSMIEKLDNLSVDDIDINIMKYAIIFHDCVEEVENDAGVEESAKVAKKLLNGNWVSTLVENIIMATDYKHNKDVINYSRYQKIMMDLDFAELGSHEINYIKNSDNIREEYDIFTDEEWKEGRTKFLNMMLAKEKIFLTDEFSHLEAKARENISEELADLQEKE